MSNVKSRNYFTCKRCIAKTRNKLRSRRCVRLCSAFGLSFLVLSVTRRSPPLGQVLVRTFNHENCNVHSPKAFETLIHENVTHIVLVIVLNMFSFGFIEVFDSNVSECARITSFVGNNQVLKIAVHNVTLELCDSCDYFASSLLVKKAD